MKRAIHGAFVGVSLLVLVCSTTAARPLTSPRSLAAELTPVDQIAHRVVPAPDIGAALRSDRRAGDRGRYRVAVPVAVTLTPETAGSWERLPGGAVWRLRVTSPGARFLSFKFSDFDLGPAVELHFFSVARDYFDGPYTARHNREPRRFGSPMVPGDSAVIELWVPEGAAEPALKLESVSHGFRDAMGLHRVPLRTPRLTERPETVGPEASPPPFACQRDINCPEGLAYQVEKQAAAEGYDGVYTCSGQMLNNVRQDGAYLYLTADHCEWWRDPGTMAWYWNYENSGCGTNDAPFTFSTGATSLYSDAVADLNLLLLDGVDLEGRYGLYFLGWDASPLPPATAAMISFPADKPKQIVEDSGPVTDCAVQACPNGYGPQYWRIEDWEVGVDEQGSSGGALLDASRRVRGVLSSGVGTNCNDFDWDEFAKIHTEWTSLAPFLDPDDTGATFLDGTDGSAAPPPVAATMTLARGAGDAIQVSIDTTTCADDRVVALWGTLGDWSGYQGDVGPDCSLGNGGNAVFDFAADNVWFNLVWVSADDTAGHPGDSSSGPRAWNATGFCQVVAEDHSDAVCD